MRLGIHAVLAALSILVLSAVSTPARAGLGCEKPAPVLATASPHATYAGSDVTLLHADFGVLSVLPVNREATQ